MLGTSAGEKARPWRLTRALVIDRKPLFEGQMRAYRVFRQKAVFDPDPLRELPVPFPAGSPFS